MSDPIPVPEPVSKGQILLCPECGRPSITDQQYTTHYRAAHSPVRDRHKVCEECGEDFHDNYHPTQRYCSPRCAADARKVRA